MDPALVDIGTMDSFVDFDSDEEICKRVLSKELPYERGDYFLSIVELTTDGGRISRPDLTRKIYNLDS